MATPNNQDGDAQQLRWRHLTTKMATPNNQDGDAQQPKLKGQKTTKMATPKKTKMATANILNLMDKNKPRWKRARDVERESERESE